MVRLASNENSRLFQHPVRLGLHEQRGEGFSPPQSVTPSAQHMRQMVRLSVVPMLNTSMSSDFCPTLTRASMTTRIGLLAHLDGWTSIQHRSWAGAFLHPDRTRHPKPRMTWR